jgi:hypothetical protein
MKRPPPKIDDILAAEKSTDSHHARKIRTSKKS